VLFGKKLQAVTADDIQAVIENGVREDRHIDYKRSLPDKTKDNDRKELLADVSAFANTSGGDILFGVDEERNEKGEPTGIPRRSSRSTATPWMARSGGSLRCSRPGLTRRSSPARRSRKS
jgi:hypothetical protein